MHNTRQNDAARLGLDSIPTAALIGALALVFTYDQSNPPTPTATVETIPVKPSPLKGGPSLRLSVIPSNTEFDDMGRLLDSLGNGYSYRPNDFDQLLDIDSIKNFDIVFITCSGYPDEWLGEAVEGESRGASLFRPNDAVFTKAESTIRNYVKDGGTIYASDLHFPLIAATFPEYVAEDYITRGRKQSVKAAVVDQGLRQAVGDTIDLDFDQDGWRPAAFSGDGVTIFLDGTFLTTDGEKRTCPLLTKITHGTGNVIFTSFHNENQNSKSELELLKHLVFSAVTARADSEADRQMARGGFSAAKKNLFSASQDAETVTQTYVNTKQRDLQFSLAFPNQGGLLELTVEGPDGHSAHGEGASSFAVDIPNAAIGTWKYVIKATKLPSSEFPFTMTVGEKN